MFRKLVKSVFKLGVYAVGFGAVFGAWDYTQQWKAADGELSFGQYAIMLNDRYGDQVNDVTMSAVTIVQSGVVSGVTMVESSGVLEKMGIEMPEQMLAFVSSAEPTIEVPDTISAVPTRATSEDAPVVIASADRAVAPETSLFPRARETK